MKSGEGTGVGTFEVDEDTVEVFLEHDDTIKREENSTK